MELIGGGDKSKLLAYIAKLNHGSRETSHTIKSYTHVSAVNEISDKNDGNNEG